MATVFARVMLHGVALLVGVVYLYCVYACVHAYISLCVYMHVLCMWRLTYKQCSCAAHSDHKISLTTVNNLDTPFKNLHNLWFIGSHMSCAYIPIQQVITQFLLHA